MGSEMPVNGEDVCWIRRYTFPKNAEHDIMFFSDNVAH